MRSALGALLTAAALAQSPAPYEGSPAPAPADAAAPAASTAAAPSPSAAPAPPVVTPEPAPAPRRRRIYATLHKDAAQWTPVSLRAGGGAARTALTVRQEQVKKKVFKGKALKAKAFARLRRVKEDRWLVIGVFTGALDKKRKHFEVRFKLVEGYVEEVKAALVTVVDPRPGAGQGRTSGELAAEGVGFEEEFPSSGEVRVSALDPRPSGAAFNAGSLRRASFTDFDAGLVDLSWSVRGLPAPR